MTTPSDKADIKIIFALTLFHFTGDFYSAFTLPLLPVFVDKLALTLTQVGIITGVMRFLAFVVQPLVGYFADRYPTRLYAFGGLFLTAIFIPLSGIAPSFYLLVLLLAIGSAGSSIFHPSVTGMVPLFSGRQAGFSMSVFNTGGTLAFGVGPVFITWLVARYGLEAMPVTSLIGLSILVVLYRMIPPVEAELASGSGFLKSIQETLGEVWQAIVLIWLVMVLRAVTGQAFLTFMPVHLARKGHSLVAIGTVTALFVVAGTVSGLLAGYFSDKIEHKSIFYVAHALMIPALLIFLHSPGDWVYVGAFAAGFFVMATLPMGVVMAQQLAPRGRSMVASLMMGFAYGLGGLVSPLTGNLADTYSIETVLTCAAFLPLISLVLIYFFPRMETDSRSKLT